MYLTEEYKALPNELKNWIEDAVSKIERPARQDVVRADLAHLLIVDYQRMDHSVSAVLDKYGPADVEADKNRFVNRLPENNQWIIWMAAAIFCTVLTILCVVSVLMRDFSFASFAAQPAIAHGGTPLNGGLNGAGDYDGGALVRLLFFAPLAVFCIWKTVKEKKRKQVLYAEYVKLHSWANFDGRAFPYKYSVQKLTNSDDFTNSKDDYCHKSVGIR